MNSIRLFSFLYTKVEEMKSDSISDLFDFFAKLETNVKFKQDLLLDEKYTLQVLRRFIDDETIIKQHPEYPNEIIKETIRSYILRLAKANFEIFMMAYDSLYNHEEAEINEREIVDRMKNNIITLRLNDKFDFDDSRSYLEWR